MFNPANTIADSTVKLTDADLQKAFNENIKSYEQPEETRKLDYVTLMLCHLTKTEL